MNYYERHIGDYLKDTAHLSLLEHGIYTRLLDVYYTREGAIPESDAARLIGARSKDEREALKAVLSEFFKLVEGACVQDRADREIARFKDKQAKAKKSAEARWGAQPPQSECNANASQTHDAQAMRTQSEGNATRARPQSPVTSNQNKTPLPPCGGADRFAEFWALWPKSRRKGSKGKCEELWGKAKLDTQAETILAHVKAMAATPDWLKENGAYIPAPEVYLRGERWDGADIGDQAESIFAGGV
jgi:uncharacterized protein YdaU (DUF1376 family)